MCACDESLQKGGDREADNRRNRRFKKRKKTSSPPPAGLTTVMQKRGSKVSLGRGEGRGGGRGIALTHPSLQPRRRPITPTLHAHILTLPCPPSPSGKKYKTQCNQKKRLPWRSRAKRKAKKQGVEARKTTGSSFYFSFASVFAFVRLLLSSCSYLAYTAWLQQSWGWAGTGPSLPSRTTFFFFFTGPVFFSGYHTFALGKVGGKGRGKKTCPTSVAWRARSQVRYAR